jgi:hypothetical protein
MATHLPSGLEEDTTAVLVPGLAFESAPQRPSGTGVDGRGRSMTRAADRRYRFHPGSRVDGTRLRLFSDFLISFSSDAET